MADVFHTFFGVAGLSLLGHEGLHEIDPTYALCTTTLKRLGVTWKKLPEYQADNNNNQTSSQ